MQALAKNAENNDRILINLDQLPSAKAEGWQYTPLRKKLKDALSASSMLSLTDRWSNLRVISQDHVFKSISAGIFSRLAYKVTQKNPSIRLDTLISFQLKLLEPNKKPFVFEIGDTVRSNAIMRIFNARDRILGRRRVNF